MGLNPVREADVDYIGLHVHSGAENRAAAAFQNPDTSLR
jgi:hypothetical protein